MLSKVGHPPPKELPDYLPISENLIRPGLVEITMDKICYKTNVKKGSEFVLHKTQIKPKQLLKY